MNISSVSKLVSNSVTGLNLKRRIFEFMPAITLPNADTLNKIGTIISRPDVNRGIMGATAILSQPFIDYYNPKVDKETAEVSTCRTIGKIIAGTAVGCAVRSACYYGTKALTNTSKTAKAWQQLLLPNKNVVTYLTKKYPDWLKNYNSALATVIGLLAMLVTNVVIDVPLTHFITKHLLAKFKKHDAEQIQPNNTNTPKQEPYDVVEKFKDIFINHPAELNGRRAK
ncbi:hypothetical protein J6O48_09790 [bacterium]|nr:hypothetical protein [bacterium]